MSEELSESQSSIKSSQIQSSELKSENQNQSQTQANAFLVTEKVGKLMKMYSIPCIISLLVAALYNIVDQIFIANASYLGSYGNAANTVVFPLTVVALALAVMIGDGTCAFVSICLGRNEKENANQAVGNAITLSVIVGVVITIIYLIFLNPIISFFGARVNEETFKQSQIYFFWITVGLPFYVFGQAMNPIIRSDGSPRFAMVSQVSGAILNIILDPIFIFAFKWGMMGAAIATVAGQILTAALAIWYLCHTKALKLNRKSFKLQNQIVKKSLSLGITSFLSQISLVCAMAAINQMIKKYSPDFAINAARNEPNYSPEQLTQIPMAVVGIVMKFFQIVISVAVGMAAGCIPIVGYNIGSGRKDRAKKLYTLLLFFEALLGAVALVIVEVFPGALIKIFGASNESQVYTVFAKQAFRTYLCMMIFATVNKGNFIYLQALGKAFASTAISMIREVVFGVGFAILLPLITVPGNKMNPLPHQMGLDGILWSMPLSDFLTAVISVFVIIYTFKELSQDSSSVAK